MGDSINDSVKVALWRLVAPEISSAMFWIVFLSEITLSIQVNDCVKTLLAREHGVPTRLVGAKLFGRTEFDPRREGIVYYSVCDYD